MAIKDQCTQCSCYSGGSCKIQGYPVFDQISCESYRKNGINLDKGRARRSPSSSPAPSPVYNSQPTSGSNSGYSPQPSPQTKQGMFSNPFSFSGRIRRLEFGISFILVYVYAIIVGYIVGSMGGSEGMMYLLLIPGYWFQFAQGAKRCHDRGNSGWYQIIPFYFLWMLFAPGDAYDNSYGPDPKR